ncbi:unnamed protein product, partial [Meganyctiphanes norvegica]
VRLECKRNTDAINFYGLYWYKDEEMIYKYFPDALYPGEIIEVPGVIIDDSESNGNVLQLKNVTEETSGVYMCNVLGEAPSFYSSSASKKLDIESLKWSQLTNACIRSNNEKIVFTPTIEICKEKCIKEYGIACRSIEFNRVSGTCALSSARSTSQDYEEPCHVDGWTFTEMLS